MKFFLKRISSTDIINYCKMHVNAVSSQIFEGKIIFQGSK